ncbi:Retrovirus-related Pol polyprotein from transposon TNT 1-94 [Gossypium australe]|uniref:Retrovirus-related Pol polyprotein from transposon TNT 1-94 n=1 Tax=Gossypium australe TaxID=47621 RepID=A0A5B6VPY4_9ROSI|nr:Retrovirus-related Pol polyprotein from transposon TNT 1-94 [Gossypium australe]
MSTIGPLVSCTNLISLKICPRLKAKVLSMRCVNLENKLGFHFQPTKAREPLTSYTWSILIHCWVYFLKLKSEVACVFWKCKATVENQASYKLKILMSDNGTEYTSERFKRYCEAKGIHHQLTNTYTPHHKCICERKNRIMMNMARCLLFEIVKRRKLEKRSLAITTTKKQYKIFNPFTKKVIVSKDVKFNERSGWNWDATEVELLEQGELELDLQSVENQAQDDEGFDDFPIRGTKSIAEVHQRCDLVALELTNFEDVAQENGWKEVMEYEMTMIHKNQTWELVNRPVYNKVIRVKWEYKTNFNADGSLNKLKAKLVVKGFSR